MNASGKNVGLVGVGGFGYQHLKELIEGEGEHDLRVVAVADPGPLSNEACKLIGNRTIGRYRDMSAMLDAEKIDGLIISSPISLHFDMTSAAIKKCVPIYLEKPPVLSLSQLDQLISEGGENLVHVGFHMMSWPKVREALNILGAGGVGGVQAMRILALWPRHTAYYHRNSWAGKFSELGNLVIDGPASNATSHFVQMLCAAADAVGAGDLVDLRGEFYRARAIESYDTCSLVGKFASGMEFAMVMSHACDGGQVSHFSIDSDLGHFEIGDEQLTQINAAETRRPLAAAYQDFGSFVRGETRRPRVTLGDCRNYLKIATGLIPSPGVIRTIPGRDVSIINNEKGEFFSVNGLFDDSRRCLAQLKTFSEAGLGWAVTSEACVAL